jgi:glycosyl transferase, family 25
MDFGFLNNYFDCVYVLTIERAHDRQEHFKNQFKGLKFEFIYGIDRRDINFDNKTWKGTVEDLNNVGIDLSKLNGKHERKPAMMHPGEVACSCGHNIIMKKMIENNYKNVLIFEDDATTLLTNYESFIKTLEDIPLNWDLLYLGYGKNEEIIKKPIKMFFYTMLHYLKISGWNKIPIDYINRMYPIKYNNNWNRAGEHYLTHAYAISSRFAERCIEMQTPIQYVADRLLTFALLKDHELNGYAAVNKLFEALDFNNPKVKSYINSD